MGNSEVVKMLYLIGAHILHRVDVGNGELVSGDEAIDPL